jgi:prepilin-type N-terminal cleavage/methylation domain-containing protein
MTARHTPGRRAGFTLIELLVAMTIIVVLATIAIAVVPGAIDQDRTTDAAATVRQHLMIAKARATRENNGRGIRFITGLDPNNPAKTSAFFSTEMLYIESAPTIVPNPFGLTGPGDPFVDVTNGRTATLFNMPATSEAVLVVQNDLAARWFPKLYCPELGENSFSQTARYEILDLQPGPVANSWTLTLAFPTDPPPLLTLLGAGTAERSYRFAIEPRSRPLLGEPNITLPKNVCVDLTPFVSVPGARVVGGGPVDFEVMFSPSGQVMDPQTSGTIYLWVRDYTKTPSMLPLTPNATNLNAPYTYAAGPAQFQGGGEQQLVAIKARSGALGVFPTFWPQADGTYPVAPPGQPAFNPFYLASKDASSP